MVSEQVHGLETIPSYIADQKFVRKLTPFVYRIGQFWDGGGIEWKLHFIVICGPGST
jgi:hypothetical protein